MPAPPIVVYTHCVPAVGPALLRDACDVREAPGDATPSADEIVHRAHDADALCFFVPDRIDDALLARLPRLRVLAGFGKGYDNVDIEAARARGIVVTNVPRGLTAATADLAWALLLALARRVAAGDAFVRAGNVPGWDARRFLGFGVSGKTIGLYGFGEIGRAIARRAGGFAMRVLYYDVLRAALDVERALDATHVTRDRLLAASDYLVLAVPLAAGSGGAVIGARELAVMPKHANLINIARGSLVDEDALAAALAENRLAGYASDVFACEDPLSPNRPHCVEPRLLADRTRTVFTPHLGTAVAEDREELARVQAACVLAALRGERPEGLVAAPTA